MMVSQSGVKLNFVYVKFAFFEMCGENYRGFRFKTKIVSPKLSRCTGYTAVLCAFL